MTGPKNVPGRGDHAEVVSQPSWRPTAKVLATWVTGAGATTVLGLLTVLSDTVDVQTFWGGLLVAGGTAVAGWLKKNRVTDV